MKAAKLVGLALVVVGVALLAFGYNASQSVGEQLTEGFTGRFTETTMAYLIGGGVAIVVGLVMLLKK